MQEYTVILVNGLAVKIRAETLSIEQGHYQLLVGDEIVAVIPNTAYVCKMDSQDSIAQLEPAFQ